MTCFQVGREQSGRIGAVGAYVAPVRFGTDGSVQPGNLRESIRHAGPTIELPAASGL